MKKPILFIIFILLILSAQAQVPQAFSYKVQIKGNNGYPHANKKINLKISILQDNVDGTPVYIEKHQVNTSQSGIVDIEIGRGTPILGLFSEIDWKHWPYFVKAELDLKCGSNYNLLAVTELLSVPYAMYAGNAANGFSGDYNDLINKPFLSDSINWNQAYLWGDHKDAGYVQYESKIMQLVSNVLKSSEDKNKAIVTNLRMPLNPNDAATKEYVDSVLSLCVHSNDMDNDGFTSKLDCNDRDSSIHPFAIEICGDGIDQNCDGSDLNCDQIDEDNDKDGFSENQGDCNDNEPSIYPGAIEIIEDGIDQDCNGADLTCDILFLIDNTGSLAGEITNLKSGINQIIGTFPNIAIGISTFQDFPISPYGIASDYPYKLNLQITKDYNLILNCLNQIQVGHGGDTPESGNEALYQVANGSGISYPGNSIPAYNVGFRAGSKKIIILITDAQFHNNDYNFFTHSQIQAIDAVNQIGANVISINSGGLENRVNLLPYSLQTNTNMPVDSNGTCPTGINGSSIDPIDGLCPLVYDISSDGTGITVHIISAIEALLNK
jgi:hypothetical protein